MGLWRFALPRVHLPGRRRCGEHEDEPRRRAGGIAETEAELSHALMIRDILIARINALSDQLEQVYQSNAARVLDAKTLDAIQAQYNSCASRW